MRIELGRTSATGRPRPAARATRCPLLGARRRCPGRRAARASIGPTRMRGSSDAYGSWNISCRSRRASLQRATCGASSMSSPVEADRARRRPMQRHDQPADRRLPAARLADEPERLAAADAERDVRDRLHRPDLPLEDGARGHRELLARGGRSDSSTVAARRLALDERRCARRRALASTRIDLARRLAPRSPTRRPGGSRRRRARRRGSRRAAPESRCARCRRPAACRRPSPERAAAPRPGSARCA